METSTAVAYLIGAAVLVGSAAAFGVLLYRAGRLPGNGPLIVSLSMLAVVALLIGAVQESATAITIAGTAVGALAAALAGATRPPSDGP